MIEPRDRGTRERSAPRNPTAMAVSCRPYVSSGDVRAADGVMHNFSAEGALIETTRSFNPGTILIVRMLVFSSEKSDSPEEACPRSIGLAEVKWHHAVDTDEGPRHAMGIRYL